MADSTRKLRAANHTISDVIIIGTGFAGLYAVHKLRDHLHLRVRAFDRASDVGGTWYWNRYPGARCDIEAVFYAYSFSEELDQEWSWSERFASQPEILRYLTHVVDRFDLRRDIQFDTAITSVVWDATSTEWVVGTAKGDSYRRSSLSLPRVFCQFRRSPSFPVLRTSIAMS